MNCSIQCHQEFIILMLPIEILGYANYGTFQLEHKYVNALKFPIAQVDTFVSLYIAKKQSVVANITVISAVMLLIKTIVLPFSAQ